MMAFGVAVAILVAIAYGWLLQRAHDAGGRALVSRVFKRAAVAVIASSVVAMFFFLLPARSSGSELFLISLLAGAAATVAAGILTLCIGVPTLIAFDRLRDRPLEARALSSAIWFVAWAIPVFILHATGAGGWLLKPLPELVVAGWIGSWGLWVAICAIVAAPVPVPAESPLR